MLCASQSAFANNTSYVLAARQTALLKTQNRISDMVANANTTGFKSESDVYSELNKRMEDGKKLSYSRIKTSTRNTEQGTMVVTNRQLDIAISGPGYFMIDTPRGHRYTRAGNLQVTADGVLTTKEGYPLLGSGGGQVELAPEDVEITIRENGLVTVGSEERGEIAIFLFENENAMVKEGSSTYRSEEKPAVSENSKIAQGMLENSNVNSVTAMTDLIEVSRNIETVKQMQSDFHGLQINAIRTLLKQ